MIVMKSSVFPAARETVFEKLQKLETLQYIARPYATLSLWEQPSWSGKSAVHLLIVFVSLA